jgi:hypothetical protein
MPRRNVDGSSRAGFSFCPRPPSGSSRHRYIDPSSNTMLARSETRGTSSKLPSVARYKARCPYLSRRLWPICQPAPICVTTLGSTGGPTEEDMSSIASQQPRRKKTRKRKNKSLPSFNGKRIDPSGGVSIMFLGSIAMGHALRFRGCCGAYIS